MVEGGCKGLLWDPSIIGFLLRAIHRSLALFLLMDSTTTPNWATWDDIAADMSTRSVPRSVMQIRAQWKAKKAVFHWEKAYWEAHGRPSDAPPDTYQQIHQLWCHTGHRTYRDRCYAGK